MVGSGRYPNPRPDAGEGMDVDQAANSLPQCLDGDGEEDTTQNVVFERRRIRDSTKGKSKNKKAKTGVDKTWILKKKEVCFIFHASTYFVISYFVQWFDFVISLVSLRISVCSKSVDHRINTTTSMNSRNLTNAQ
jgi:hypothetical protein